MYEFHQDKSRYFEIQYRVTAEHIFPFIVQHTGRDTFPRVLEIGCGEAGVLKYFIERGSHCTGIELSSYRVDLAKTLHADAIREGRIDIINRNIYDIDPDRDLPARFDLIILKDVIEHIPDQATFLRHLKSFLVPDGIVFFGFPPWQMPYGGHQQICQHKFLSVLPYYHLLPMALYQWILSAGGESAATRQELREIKQTGISIERFERCVRQADVHIHHRTIWLINPIYSYKFKMKPRRQNFIIASIPWFRNFFSSAAYYIVDLASMQQNKTFIEGFRRSSDN